MCESCCVCEAQGRWHGTLCCNMHVFVIYVHCKYHIYCSNVVLPSAAWLSTALNRVTREFLLASYWVCQIMWHSSWVSSHMLQGRPCFHFSACSFRVALEWLGLWMHRHDLYGFLCCVLPWLLAVSLFRCPRRELCYCGHSCVCSWNIHLILGLVLCSTHNRTRKQIATALAKLDKALTLWRLRTCVKWTYYSREFCSMVVWLLFGILQVAMDIEHTNTCRMGRLMKCWLTWVAVPMRIEACSAVLSVSVILCRENYSIACRLVCSVSNSTEQPVSSFCFNFLCLPFFSLPSALTPCWFVDLV